jgi:hypothetical protein
MSTDKYYECKLSNNWIRYSIIGKNNDIADMRLFNFNLEKQKLWLKLLRDSIDDLKKNNIKVMRQATTLSDYDEIKNKTTWKIVEKLDAYDSVLMECDIDDFLKNYGMCVLN